MSRYVAVIGSRSLPPAWASQVCMVVGCLSQRGFGVGTGGAIGADLFALRAVVASGSALCARSVVYLPGSVSQAPRACQPALASFAAAGGRVVEGPAKVGSSRRVFVSALFARSRALVAGSSGVVAFVSGPSRGTWYTCRLAARRGLPVVVFPVGGPRSLVSLGCGSWAPVGIWPGAFRWVPSVPYGTRCRHGVLVQHCTVELPPNRSS